MTGPEHYQAAENLMAEAAKHRAAAEENIQMARGSHLPEKEAYVTRAQVYALIYSGMMAQANTHATLASTAATALTGGMAKAMGYDLELDDWVKASSAHYDPDA